MADICTVVSACPFPLQEKKPGLQPGVFNIPAANIERQEVQTLPIQACTYPVYMDHDRGSFVVVEHPSRVAKAIVDDFCSSQLAADSEAGPAVFWVDGDYTPETAKKLLQDRILSAMKRQAEWFRRLVQLADDDWAKTKQHKFITDIQRYAGKALGLQREWLVKPQSITSQECPGCAKEISGKALKCPNCQTIVNVSGWKALQELQAKVLAADKV